MGDGSDPAQWYPTNLVGIPTSIFASVDFNEHPLPLHVAGARESHPGLFALLVHCPDAVQARVVFAHYMTIAFGLQRLSAEERAAAPGRRFRANYLKLLQGWGLDANSAAGAVLKGWVESRFGLVPVFHKARLERFPSPAWMQYLEDKASPRFNNNAIYQQLDLLFEFSQWMLARFAPLGDGPAIELWRGSTRCEEQVVVGTLRQRRCTVRLNNVVSFSRSRELACCFGDWLLRARVPLVKLLVWPGLLDTASLDGEGEVLAIGGEYDVLASYA